MKSMTRRSFMETSTVALAANMISTQTPLPEKKLRAVVIGDTQHGGYGHDLHLVWASHPEVEVVAVADPDEAGRLQHAAAAKAQRTYADYREMLDKEKPDLVTVGPRWTSHHREYLQTAAACGAHGLMEKPVAAALTEADEMVKAIEAASLKWSIGFNFRALPIFSYAKRLIEQGLIGTLLEMRGRGKEDARAGGEDLMVLGTHIFDLMRFFAGDARWCMADITTDGRPAQKSDVHEGTEPVGPIVGDRIHATYGFDHNVVGFFASVKTTQVNGGRWGLDLYGTNGVITIRQNGGASIRLLRASTWAAKNANWEPLPDAPSGEFENDDRYVYIVNDLLAAIRENRRPQVSLQDGCASLEMIQALYEAYLHGGRVTLPLSKRTHPLKRWT